jgi:ABC-type lipoprotein release transport system permease subunit
MVAVLLLAALSASFPRARRASRADPISALRQERLRGNEFAG